MDEDMRTLQRLFLRRRENLLKMAGSLQDHGMAQESVTAQMMADQFLMLATDMDAAFPERPGTAGRVTPDPGPQTPA